MRSKDHDRSLSRQDVVARTLTNILRTLDYTLRPVREDYFDASTRDALQRFQAEQGLEKTDHLDAATIEALAQAYQKALRGAYVVEGMIRYADGSPAVGVEVAAYDLDPSTAPDLLGIPAITDAEGYYRIGYTEEHFKKPVESGGPDIVIRVEDKDGNLLGQLKEDERISNSERETTIDLVLETTVQQEDTFDTPEARTQKYAELGGLSAAKTRRLVEKGIDLHRANDAVLETLVQEQVLTKKEKEKLRLSIDLGRLTGQHFALVEVLKNDRLRSAEEFADWDEADWKKVLEDHQIPVPETEKSLDSYAENLRETTERSFPSAYFLRRVTKADVAQHTRDLETINLLHQQDKPLIKGRRANLAEIDWRGVNDTEKTKISESLRQLTAVANTYRHLGLREIINDAELDKTAKQAAMQEATRALRTFYANNPKLDLRKTDFLAKDNGLKWTDIPTQYREGIRKQLMAYQRCLTLADEQATREKMLAAGYDSAVAIAKVSEQQFLAETKLDKASGRKAYRKAQNQAAGVVHFTQALKDNEFGLFRRTNVSNVGSITNVIRDIDGYEALFGPQNYCGCAHCRSIFSPAAYFTDLMYFVEKKVSENVFIPTELNPHDRRNHPLYLKNRRPDLWKLQLTCENTNTEIPYLEIVNEVLEQYLENELGISEIYDELASSTAAMGLPFNLPLEELRLFLSHFELSLQEIYRQLQVSGERQAREQLGMATSAELELITHRDKVIARQVFGREPLGDFDVRRFLEYTGITRSELDDLLQVATVSEIAQVQVNRIKIPDDIQQYREVLDGLDNNRIDLIHRFLRLWRKTPWSIPEFDRILQALGINELGESHQKETPPTSRPGRGTGDQVFVTHQSPSRILELGAWMQIQKRLKLSADELTAVIGVMPDRHFEQLFYVEKLFAGNSQVTLLANPEKDKVRPILRAGLGISEAALASLLAFVGLDTTDDSEIDRSFIGQLYQQVRIARGLGLTVEDLISAAKLINSGRAIHGVEQLHTLLACYDWVDASPLTIADLLFVIEGEESSKRHYAIDLAAVIEPILKSQELKDPEDPNSGYFYTDAERLNILGTYLQETFQLTAAQLEEEFLPELIAQDLDSPAVQQALDATFVEGAPNDPEELAGWLELVRAVERKVYLFRKLDFAAEEISLLITHKAWWGINDLNDLHPNDIRNLSYYHNLTKGGEKAAAKIREVMASYDTANRMFSEESASILAGLWEQPPAQVQSLIDIADFDFPEVPVAAIYTLKNLSELGQKLGVGGTSLYNLCSDDFVRAREAALATFAAKYTDEKERQEKLEPYYDQIRTRKRDALCDYIISQRDKFKFQDRSDLYQFFLLDVEMSGCFRTSRVVSAISSLQVYIHRCLLNLEQSDPAINPNFERVKVNPTLIPVAEWEWRKNYRVWEANRKVFLYPENYLDPTLRESKTPLFKELEDELLQENISQQSAEAAYKKYMASFVELANLRYAGAYYHDRDIELVPLDAVTENDSSEDPAYVINTVLREEADCLYYFFARTNTDPYRYYYRTYNELSDSWGHWEKIDLAIEAEEVSALMYQGKIYLFWTEVQWEIKEKIEDDDSKSDATIFKIVLNYSYLNENGKWSSPQRAYIGFTHMKDQRICQLFNPLHLKISD